MKAKKIFSIIALTTIIAISSSTFAFADQFNVITLGANLTQEQKKDMLKYFNAKEGTYQLININNKEEREALKGIASAAEIGNKTISCSYVQPTKAGSGINVKTVNLTWVTASMISNTLVTAGINDANVIAAAPFQVSGTGALTGILKGFEDSTGNKLDSEKKELANKELVTTGNLANDSNIGQEKAAAVVNDVKTQVIKDKAETPNTVNNIINNVTNNYNIKLTPEQEKELSNLMIDIGKQGYNYDEMKNTLNEIGKNIQDVLESSGQAIKDSGFFQNIWNNIKEFFSGAKEKVENKAEDTGILNQTNNEALGDSTVVTGTNNEIQQSGENNNKQSTEDEGIFTKFVNWVKGLFNSDSSQESTSSNNPSQSTTN
ncbi:DUF1002 domain-containing protein [Clostridium sardiniense]|uniref:DUF1002 domain-containing protein n=1 Tax=Clostridium sardiniense TaxID=29369 RepID=UPI001958AC92|nr:DUF1002 domain-containing protein [Clostridium sardiniense]MBM7835895.1 uncharacterized protein YpuA (DUF1002 family) [Clostridium sardiniense]